MSMSDDVQRAGAPKKEGTGLKNPYASAGAGQNGGKPATGLPGLAAFGQMQTYTPQTAQPRQPQQEQPEQRAPEPEQYAAPEQEPVYEQPSYQDAPAYEQSFATEPDFAAEQPAEQEYTFQADEPYEQEQTFRAESAPEFMQPDEEPGTAAEANPYAYRGNDEPQAEQGPELSFNDLTDIYRNGSQDQAGDDAAYEFTADDLQSYMASNAQGAHDDQQPEEEEFDLTKHMSLQPFEARYDQQQRQVNLGGYDDEPGDQPFFHPEQQGDADFLGDEENDGQMPPPRERKSRRVLMFASGLIGALALGGALAFAYKMTGETQVADGSGPPLIKADDSPVKVPPEEPGGKQFAHQNKQIYDRLQGDQKPEVERIVPRQEAVQATPPATGEGANVAATNNGGPHKVRTLKVMPDGSVVVSAPPDDAAPAPSAPAQRAPAQQQQMMPMQSAQPSIPALPAPGSETVGVAVTMPPEPQQADQTTVASVPSQQQQQTVAAQPMQQQQVSSDAAPAPMPQPKPTAPARQTASVAPQQAATSGSGYAVQVASRRSQAMALAAFADLQQKYTSLLGDYQPMIQSADLGDKGVWYRLRVGPIGQKAQADSLCENLKRAGLRSCLVRPL